jgi:oligoendopeptidase F
MQESCTAVSTDLVFFTLELNRLEEGVLRDKLQAAELAHYAPWLRDLRAMRPHQLSDDIERLLHEKYVAGRAAWTRLFDETMASLRFPFKGEQLTSAEILNRLTERDPAARREAAKSLGKVLGDSAGPGSPGASAISRARIRHSPVRSRRTGYPSDRASANRSADIRASTKCPRCDRAAAVGAGGRRRTVHPGRCRHGPCSSIPLPRSRSLLRPR